MGSFLGSLTFLNPWVLAGLVFLPVLWFLLRVTPPPPRRIMFPAARFLDGLVPKDQPARRTPWWILLLRLALAAIVILALAGPVLNPASALQGRGAVRVVIDNGWASAQNWPSMLDQAETIITQAGRENRAVMLMTTTPEPGTDKPFASRLTTAGQAGALLRGLSPRPWQADFTAAADAMPPASAAIQSYLLSSGMAGTGDIDRFTRKLQNEGGLTLFTPAPDRMPILLRPAQQAEDGLTVRLDQLPASGPHAPLMIQAMNGRGDVLDIAQPRLTGQGGDVRFALKGASEETVAKIAIPGRPGAGGVLLFDARGRKSVGIVSTGNDKQQAPLTEAGFYLSRALSASATVTLAPLPALLSADPAVIILPDIGAMPPQELNALEAWVQKGGLLLRFAGPNMSQAENFLTPVPLRAGDRAFDGSMTWEKPPRLRPFPETSPYFGLEIPDDLAVRRQLLASPVADIDRKSWAVLEDGTPLITAAPLGKGRLVMVHTTATPQWSNLPLSGLFVKLLERTVALAGSGAASNQGMQGTLEPLSVLNGFGVAEAPDASVEPLPMTGAPTIDSRHPPGLYGREGVAAVLNLGDSLAALRPLPAPPGAGRSTYAASDEIDLMPRLLLAAAMLFFADWLLMTLLQHLGGLRPRRLIAACLLLLPATAHAQDMSAVAQAGQITLAYIASGDAVADATSRAGLEALKAILTERTSVEPASVVALDPARDDLSFFPLIYWPIRPAGEALNEEATLRVQSYLDHGGMILFDTGDGGTRGSAALRRVAGALNLPPLVQMPADHVLTRSFYLTRGLPGRFESGQIWIDERSADSRDRVSPIIVGGNDWATAWADRAQNPQSEMALRAGVNIVLYALTGNYKADQVHLNAILDRIDR